MRRAAGFTFIEVAVVLVILALTASVLTLHLRADRASDRAIERLRIALELSADQAQIRGTPLMVEFLPQGYRFSRFDVAGRWVEVRDEALLTEQRLPSDMAWLGLQIDGQSAMPRLVLSGEMPAFELRVRTSAGTVRLLGSPSGAVRTARDEPGGI